MGKKIFIGIMVSVLTMLFSALSMAETNFHKLADRDCNKCHPREVKQIFERGKLHKTEVGCIDCHKEHPPIGKNTIAACADCHAPTKSAHYALKECKICHYPHYPMEMDFDKIDDVKPACVSCHPSEGQENITYPSAHSDLDCKECHLKHGDSTPCMECHEPHTPSMTHKNCLQCHKPHRPTAIKYDATVTSALCAGCHNEVVNQVNERGDKHKTAVSCIECHLQHPPAEKGVIPECADCHAPTDKPHYNLENCALCHHPHYPMEMELDKLESVKTACLSCHPRPGQDMRNHPSKHARLDCRECHPKHGKSTPCAGCHEPHTPNMTHEDCLQCHRPHGPLEVTYSNNTPSSLCVSCHASAGKSLAATKTKHKSLQCVYCHKNKHKSMFDCGTCHGEPHSFDLHAKYPNCLKCHENPHGLIK